MGHQNMKFSMCKYLYSLSRNQVYVDKANKVSDILTMQETAIFSTAAVVRGTSPDG